MSHEGLHEPAELLSDATKNLHRALVSLQEELEAIDWYQQRADACTDAELKAVILHNRNEEVEHGMMTLEWLRRNDAKFDETMRTYLFKDLPITEIEEAEKAAGQGGDGEGKGGAASGGTRPQDGSLGIGSLRGL
jgi:ferritin-like protein